MPRIQKDIFTPPRNSNSKGRNSKFFENTIFCVFKADSFDRKPLIRQRLKSGVQTMKSQ